MVLPVNGERQNREALCASRLHAAVGRRSIAVWANLRELCRRARHHGATLASVGLHATPNTRIRSAIGSVGATLRTLAFAKVIPQGIFGNDFAPVSLLQPVRRGSYGLIEFQASQFSI